MQDLLVDVEFNFYDFLRDAEPITIVNDQTTKRIATPLIVNLIRLMVSPHVLRVSAFAISRGDRVTRDHPIE